MNHKPHTKPNVVGVAVVLMVPGVGIVLGFVKLVALIF